MYDMGRYGVKAITPKAGEMDGLKLNMTHLLCMCIYIYIRKYPQVLAHESMISDLLNGSLLGPPCPQCPCSTDGVLDPHQADEVLLELRPSSLRAGPAAAGAAGGTLEALPSLDGCHKESPC